MRISPVSFRQTIQSPQAQQAQPSSQSGSQASAPQVDVNASEGEEKEHKKYIGSAIASFLLPGLGQFIKGEAGKGVRDLLIIGAILVGSFVNIFKGKSLALSFALSVANLGIRGYSAYDAATAQVDD